MAVAEEHSNRYARDTSVAHSRASHSIQIPADISTSERLTVGELCYRLSGFFVLQSLCAVLLKENRDLRAQLTMPSSRSKDQGQKTITTAAGSDGTRLHGTGDSDSLFSSLYRGMQLKLTRCEQLLASVEGMNAGGLVQVGTLAI